MLKSLLILMLGVASVSAVETGTHWAEPSEFPTLRNLGYNYAIVAINSSTEAEWARVFNAADAAGLRLIVGLYPAPYSLNNGVWTISQTGQRFLRYAATRAATVKAIFVYNEPYWLNPFTNQTNFCGNVTAAELRSLRSAIQQIWPAAKVYHDIGAPSQWAPGGTLRRQYTCIGDKYADQSAVADYVGIWFYPFDTNGRYSRASSLALLQTEMTFIRQQMRAEPVILGQSFLCPGCGEATRFPTVEELRDWNCAVRELAPESISWYVWRQAIYQDFLANRPTHWPSTSPTACAVANAPSLNAAAPASEVAINTTAPGAILSLYGSLLAEQATAATGYPLPRTLSGTVVTLNGNPVPLFFAGPSQVNIQVPWETPTGTATLQIQRSGTGSNTLPIQVQRAFPSLFTFQFNNLELAAAINAVTGSVVTTSSPIAPNGIVAVYATGLGPLPTTPTTGTALNTALALNATVQLKIGGTTAQVIYAGNAPGLAGVYQVNARVPANLTPGNYALWIELPSTNATLLSNGALLPVR
jgi:uncharacterized protein (TIGR03437 family)